MAIDPKISAHTLLGCQCGDDCLQQFSLKELKNFIHNTYNNCRPNVVAKKGDTRRPIGDMAYDIAKPGASHNPKYPHQSNKPFVLHRLAKWKGRTGHMVCRDAHRIIHDIKQNVWDKACQAVRMGADGYPHGLPTIPAEKQCMNEIKEWLIDFCERNAEKQPCGDKCRLPPHRNPSLAQLAAQLLAPMLIEWLCLRSRVAAKATGRGKVVEDEECEGVGQQEGLPGPDGSFIYVLHNIRWHDLYWKHYKVDTEDTGGTAASESYFHACRRKLFGGSLKRRTKKNKFSKCVECHRLACMWDTAGDQENPKGVRQRCKEFTQLHNNWQLCERTVYYHRRWKGRTKLGRRSSIDDGMGNDCTLFPFFKRMVPKIRPELLMKWKVQTVLVHGTALHFWMIPPWVRDDTNVALTTWLLSHAEVGYEPVMYRQMDGGSVNVNKWTYGFHAAMVGAGVVQKMYVARLPPGHTHEDVDSMHSVIAGYFEGKGRADGHNVFTIGDWFSYQQSEKGGGEWHQPGFNEEPAPPAATTSSLSCEGAIQAAFAKEHKQRKRRPTTKLQPEVKYLWAAFDVCNWIDSHLHKDFCNYKEAFDRGVLNAEMPSLCVSHSLLQRLMMKLETF